MSNQIGSHRRDIAEVFDDRHDISLMENSSEGTTKRASLRVWATAIHKFRLPKTSHAKNKIPRSGDVYRIRRISAMA